MKRIEYYKTKAPKTYGLKITSDSPFDEKSLVPYADVIKKHQMNFVIRGANIMGLAKKRKRKQH